jgi:hypothetical protein
MIPFFRKIRKKMADDNKPIKYARYAIGEIILVVIGILIALQINTWNEERKTRLIETKTLKEIRENLHVDIKEISSDIEVMDSIDNAGKAAIDYLNINTKPSESFKYDIHVSKQNPHFDPNRGGYSLLVSKGLDIVTNDSLRGAISRLYELDYPYYAKYENERVSLLINNLNPKLTNYFSFFWVDDNYFNGTSEISEAAFLKLKEDFSIINALNNAISRNKMVQNRAIRIRGYMLALIAQIEEELEKKEKLI